MNPNNKNKKNKTYHIIPNTPSKAGLAQPLILEPNTLIEIHQIVMSNKYSPAGPK
jgi:hypothetical protein